MSGVGAVRGGRGGRGYDAVQCHVMLKACHEVCHITLYNVTTKNPSNIITVWDV